MMKLNNLVLQTTLTLSAVTGLSVASSAQEVNCADIDGKLQLTLFKIPVMNVREQCGANQKCIDEINSQILFTQDGINWHTNNMQ